MVNSHNMRSRYQVVGIPWIFAGHSYFADAKQPVCRSNIQFLTVRTDMATDLIHIVPVAAIQSAPHRTLT
jgi:hypothetical protein